MQNRNYSSTSSKQKGFTLIEVLLAIVIFAVLSLAGYQILNQVQRSNSISLEKTQRLEDVQRALIILDNDFRQIAPRPFIYNGSDKQLIFAGKNTLDSEEEGVIFTRLGWSNPQNMFPRGEVLKVGYRIRENSLERVWWHYPDSDNEQNQLVRRLLTKVTGFSMRYYSEAQWKTEWTEGSKLPESIELTISLEDYGDIRRIYILPGQINVDAQEVTQ